MRIVIVGGGVSGLAVAHQVARGNEVTVLEASPEPRGGGYMIDFFGPGYAAAKRMGLLEELRSRGKLFREVRFERADRSASGRADAELLAEAAGGRYFSILRPEVERGLLAQLPRSVQLRYGASVQGVRGTRLRGGGSPQGALVELEGGERVEADLVIGADGVRSALREHVAPGHGAVVPMGYRAASFLFKDPELAAELGDTAVMTDTIDRTGGLYACDERRVALFLAQRAPRGDTELRGRGRERLRREFADLHPLVDRALEHAPERFYEDLVAQSWAPRWSRGRVVLAGDAAHAVSLLAGQGTSMAIAGAEALGRALRASGPHVEAGLAEYERRLRPLTERTQRQGRRGAGLFIPGSRRDVLLRRAGLQLQAVPRLARMLRGRASVAP